MGLNVIGCTPRQRYKRVSCPMPSLHGSNVRGGHVRSEYDHFELQPGWQRQSTNSITTKQLGILENQQEETQGLLCETLMDPFNRRDLSRSVKENQRRPSTTQTARTFLPNISLRRIRSLDENRLSRPFRGYDHLNATGVQNISILSEKEDVTLGIEHDVGQLTSSQDSVLLYSKFSIDPLRVAGRKKAMYVLQELLSTEKSYVKDLCMLAHVFLQNISSSFGSMSPELTAIQDNIEQIIAFHQTLMQDFERHQRHFTSMGLARCSDRSANALDGAMKQSIEKTGQIFISKAALFQIYRPFCWNYPQALRILQQLQTRPEWETYERLCSILVKGSSAAKPSLVRRHSVDLSVNHTVLPKNESKLGILDFLIKPVQRICKYPLLLSQLRTAYTSCLASSQETVGHDGRYITSKGGVIDAAIETMKSIVGGLDNAQGAQEFANKSRVIQNRLEPHELLPASFIRNLGDCILGGSLDVVTHHSILSPSEAPLKVRYMGVFLYRGFVLLVKVKRGRVYEAKQWFPLSLFDIIDLGDSTSLLPNSFRFKSSQRNFDFSARSDREKQLWIVAILEAKKLVFASDVVVPICLRADESYSSRSFQKDLTRTLCSVRKQPLSAQPSIDISNEATTTGTSHTPDLHLPSKHSTSAHRFMVERALADVISDSILGVRAQARLTDRDQTSPSTSTTTQKRLSRRQSLSSIFRRYSTIELSWGREYASDTGISAPIQGYERELKSGAKPDSFATPRLPNKQENRMGSMDNATTRKTRSQELTAIPLNSAISESFPDINWLRQATSYSSIPHRRSNSLTQGVRELFARGQEVPIEDLGNGKPHWESTNGWSNSSNECLCPVAAPGLPSDDPTGSLLQQGLSFVRNRAQSAPGNLPKFDGSRPVSEQEGIAQVKARIRMGRQHDPISIEHDSLHRISSSSTSSISCIASNVDHQGANVDASEGLDNHLPSSTNVRLSSSVVWRRRYNSIISHFHHISP